RRRLRRTLQLFERQLARARRRLSVLKRLRSHRRTWNTGAFHALDDRFPGGPIALASRIARPHRGIGHDGLGRPGATRGARRSGPQEEARLAPEKSEGRQEDRRAEEEKERPRLRALIAGARYGAGGAVAAHPVRTSF